MSDMQAIPILLSPPDIPATARWADALGGFATEQLDGYVILRGGFGGVELHYSHTTRPDVCTETSCDIRGGGGVLGLVEHLTGLTLPQGTSFTPPLTPRPWGGMTEAYLHDPHGNLIKLGLSTDEYEQMNGEA